MDRQKHFWLYALKLENGKYYVGVTSRTPESRYKEHVGGFYASEWTKIYKPISIDQVVDLKTTTIERAQEYENKITRAYIAKYGIDNVRGGNLTYRGRYVLRFGYYWPDNGWETITLVAFMTLLMVTFGSYTIIDLVFRH